MSTVPAYPKAGESHSPVTGKAIGHLWSGTEDTTPSGYDSGASGPVPGKPGRVEVAVMKFRYAGSWA